MSSIKKTDLLARLTQRANEALSGVKADATGELNVSEEGRLPGFLRGEVAAYRSAHGSVKVEEFRAAMASQWQAQLDAVDDGDGVLSDAEQARLSPALKNDMAELMQSVSARRGVFGISGLVPMSRVELRTVIRDGLNDPSAAAVNPRDQTLWIVNRGDDSSVVMKPDGTSTRYQDGSAHFMNNPTAIAFSRGRNELATVQETTNDYNAGEHGNMFMGPTLWTANLKDFDGGAASHLDMLHHSSNAMGIAAGANSESREYWVFNGQKGSVDRYFFNKPHVLGGEDHADGETIRYVAGALKRVPGVPSHLALDTATGMLFIADTGHGRVVSLDTRQAPLVGFRLETTHSETPLYGEPTTQLEVVVPPGEVKRPSGLLLKDGHLVVSDYATGFIKVFTLDGKLKGELDTGLGRGTLKGLVEVNGELCVLDSKGNRLVAIGIRP